MTRTHDTTTRPLGRAEAIRFLKRRIGITEDPPGSNTDSRPRGIRWMQLKVAGGGSWLVGLAWCGVCACAAALHAGVEIAEPYRWASVELIGEDAKAKRNGFRGWTTDPAQVLRGDLVVLFGYEHVETVRRSHRFWRIFGLVPTIGGNTSPDTAGSQNNGGGVWPKLRALSSVDGFALVDYSHLKG